MASTDAKNIPIKNAAYRATFPIYDADGDLVTGATGLDSEVSIDAGTFADVTAEATEIATSSGVYYLDLTAAEMNGDTIAIIVKTTSSGAKTTVLVFYTATRSINDLAYPTTSGRSIDVSTGGEVGVDWANVGSPTTTLNLSATTVGTAAALTTNNDKTGYALSAAGIDAIWDEVQSGHATAGTFGLFLDAAVTSRLAPTVAARTLDVSATGEAGVDWANIGAPTTTVALSGTTVGTVTTLSSGTEETNTTPTNANDLIWNIWQRLVCKEDIVKATNVYTLYKSDSTTALGTSTLVDDSLNATRPKIA